MAHLQQSLLAWYAACRRDLPWRRTSDPYAIWVSEVMLQQTRVETVVPYFERFMERFPTAIALAEAPPDEVLATWSGLGYYRRARLLIEGARAVAARGGALPGDRDGLRAVPGIGRYTAGAIASIAFSQPVGLVDGNVARVFARVFGIDQDMRKEGMRAAEAIADEIVVRTDPGSWNQALMELGATVCTPRSPSCEACPLSSMCVARRDGRVAVLPVLSAKKPKEARRVQAIVATRARDGAVLMLRRRANRPFGGLWEPPTMEGEPHERATLRRTLASWLPIGRLTRAGSVEHVLTHRMLLVDVLRAELIGVLRARDVPDSAGYDAVRVVSLASLGEIGVATLAKKILARAAPKTP